MTVEINYTGTLTIKAENKTELYTLKKWIIDSVKYSEEANVIEIPMGSFDISDSFIDDEHDALSLLDHVVEMKEL